MVVVFLVEESVVVVGGIGVVESVEAFVVAWFVTGPTAMILLVEGL